MNTSTIPASSTRLPTVIYDFGANNGDDLSYYLKKADIVVAVEANPALALAIEERFSTEIAQGRLFVENCVLAAAGSSSDVAFYVHKTNDVLSQFPRPSEADIINFDEIVIQAKSALDLVETYGPPLYIKIDIEHYDEVILAELLLNGIRPPFISAESHSIQVFGWLVSVGGYRSFNLVSGMKVSTQYKKHAIHTAYGQEIYSFPYHSAGPFGVDIQGPWMQPNNFFKYLAAERLGWKDIHATSVIEADPHFGSLLDLRKYQPILVPAVKRILPSVLHPFAKKVKSLF